MVRTCTRDDIPRVRRLWISRFGDDPEGSADFVFSRTDPSNIYVTEEDGRIASMLIAFAGLEYRNRKGFYLYSACTQEGSERHGLMSRLVKYALDTEKSRGRDFCLLCPADDGLFDFYRKLGFNTVTYLRRAEIDIPKNIWQYAEFDITTAGRFRRMREKFADEDIVHYSDADYEKYARFLYTFGGSTAESKDAFAVYHEDGDRLIVDELLAKDTQYALKLLQAIRERTGKEKALITLPGDSSMFLGEGKKIKYAAVIGLDGDIYANLMFD